ncbi:hypothetical protein RDMS_13530 [Deinococcus sp. RL]|uniref:oxygen-dependent tRNA uridine(34) hydroxylase TrhO n=1 Tax=Deinococcus sp. RL TaxID=1489678 RepID=UPI0004D62A01|nr:rhodanese-related sulfurtransferase [Deinococcus sp. RL]KEF33213.1 hypothetical protein RDMS_13530 [Deinococcus sp. RL]
MPFPAPSPATWVVAALYQFRSLEDPAGLRGDLWQLVTRLGLCGTLIVAPEGINGTVAGSRESIDRLHAFLREAGFNRLEYKESASEERPFRRLKVRLKREIVTMGVPVQPLTQVGEFLTPAGWNALLDDPGVLVLDTRNRYEVQAGTFRGAVNPELDSFREFPAWVEAHREELAGRRIAMFCTGGIRCEKSTSLLRALGFEDVFHLRGGILRYLEEVPAGQSRWEGECFVFDRRVTVGHGLAPGTAQMCHSCGWPLTSEDTAHPHFEPGVSCHHCFGTTTPAQKAAFRERQRQYGAAGQA